MDQQSWCEEEENKRSVMMEGQVGMDKLIPWSTTVTLPILLSTHFVHADPSSRTPPHRACLVRRRLRQFVCTNSTCMRLALYDWRVPELRGSSLVR